MAYIKNGCYCADDYREEAKEYCPDKDKEKGSFSAPFIITLEIQIV